MLRLFLCAALFVFPIAAYAASETPLIESIGGEKYVQVSNSQGSRQAGEGSAVRAGDRIKTGFQSSAKVTYPDGSKVLLGRSTEYVIGEIKDGTQTNELIHGDLRAGIQKASQTLKKPKFVIKTKVGVLGVRGTDFVYRVDEKTGQAIVHTLDGTVEVSKDEQSLMTGAGQPVQRGEYVRATAAVIEPPKKFDEDRYIKAFETSQPELTLLSRTDPGLFSYASAGPSHVARNSRVELVSFQVNGIFTSQSSGGQSFSPELSWNPEFPLMKGAFSIRGNLGGFVLKGRTQSDTFFGIELGALVSAQVFGRLGLEAGPGVELWSGSHGDAGFVGDANVFWKLSTDTWLERLFVGVGYYPSSPVASGQSSNPAVQIKGGIGIQL